MAGRAVPSTSGPLQESVLPVSLAVTARLVRPALSPRTDQPRKETAMNDTDTVMSDYERERQARVKISEGNKNAVFDALATVNITLVHVEFDGEGDSGQIESVTAFRDEDRAELPSTTVAIQQVAWGDAPPVTTQSPLGSAIETLCYDYLEESNGGWENNEGAFGEFHFDVAKRTVELEFNARYVDTFTSNQTF
jgi:hypothetical protein